MENEKNNDENLESMSPEQIENMFKDIIDFDATFISDASCSDGTSCIRKP